jgi:hypothetical protein
LDQRLNAWYHQREWLGSPPGTLHVVEERINGGYEQPAFVFSAILFQVYVDRWNRAWSPQVLTNGPPFLVTLAAHIQVDPETKFWARIRWSWQRPDLPATSEMHNLLPFTTAKSTLLREALRALDDYVAPGRKRNNPNEVCADFERRLPEAIRDVREEMALNGEPRNRLLRQKDLADAFGWDVKTLRSRLRPPCRLTWERVRRMQGSRTLSRRD